MLHFCRIYADWPDKQGKIAWEKLDAHGTHALCHNEARDLHRFESYVMKKTLFPNGGLSCLSPDSGCQLRAGTGHGRPGRDPGWC